MTTPELGKIVTGAAARDAVHVAIAPVVAGELLARHFLSDEIERLGLRLGRDDSHGPSG